MVSCLLRTERMIENINLQIIYQIIDTYILEKHKITSVIVFKL